MNICIIPARGGSKRIPHKNIKYFLGKPIISYSIEAALQSNSFDKIIVSTDDQAIAEVALKSGAEVPFIRPKSLSDDHTGTTPVIKHAIEWCSENWFKPEYVCCLYATAPFIQGRILKEALIKLKSEHAKYCFSATNYVFPIERAFRIDNKQRIEMFYPEHFNTRSQDLIEAYHDAGQFYWGETNAFLNEEIIFSDIATPYLLPEYLVQDIDTMDDWNRAEALYKINFL